jgi:hypothetical protein
MSKRNLIFTLLAYVALVLGLNFWHTNYFTAPGLGFTTEALKIKYIVDYSSLIRNGFLPLFFFFKIFSIYGLLLVGLLIFRAPETFERPSNKTLYLIIFSTLLFISTYNTLNYRYHLTLYPFLIYFVAIETNGVKKKWVKYASLALVGGATFISYKQIRPYKKMIFRSNGRRELIASDESQREICKKIQKLQQESNAKVITFGASTLESFCTFDYVKFEGSSWDTEVSPRIKLQHLVEQGNDILIIGKTKKNENFLKDFIASKNEFFKNDIYSIYIPDSQ